MPAYAHHLPLFGTIRLEEILDHTIHANTSNNVLPSTHLTRFNDTIAATLQAARHLGVDRASGLLTRNKDILAGLDSAAPPRQRPLDWQHQVRNTLLATTLMIALSFHQPTEEILNRAPSLGRRTSDASRPLKDDEIVLLRLVSIARAGKDRRGQSAAVYGLSDAGLTIIETTQVLSRHFDDLARPSILEAFGNRTDIGPRLLALEPFHQRVLLPRIIDAVRRDPTGASAIAYEPRKEHQSAAHAGSSASSVVTRLFSEAGLNAKDITPGSIRRWRIRHTWATSGSEAAKEIAGQTINSTARLAGIRYGQVDHQPTRRSFPSRSAGSGQPAQLSD